jgi:hypothetical protein
LFGKEIKNNRFILKTKHSFFQFSKFDIRKSRKRAKRKKEERKKKKQTNKQTKSIIKVENQGNFMK